MKFRILVPLISLSFLCVYAEPPPGKNTEDTKKGGSDKPGKPEEKPKDDAKEKPKQSETSHSLSLPTGKLDYTATAGTLPIKDAEGKNTADIFFIAYTRTKEGSA